MKKTGTDPSAVIIMPKYKKDKRLNIDKEFGAPPANLYIPLGWDEDQDTKRKHYRKYYMDELENNREIFPTESPFNSYKMIRGQARGGSSNGLFSKAKVADPSG